MKNQYASFDEYGLLHFVAHLRKANRREDLYRLLVTDKKWMEVKSVRLMGDSSYVNDLEAAMGDLVGHLTPDEVLGLAQLCAARQIVDMRVNILTDLDLKVLVALKREAEALTHARLRSDYKTKFASLFFLYNLAKNAGRSTITLLTETEKIAWLIDDNTPRANAFSAIAKEYRNLGHSREAQTALDEAEKAARTIDNDYFRWKALGEIAYAYVESKKIAEALKMVQTIPDIEKRIEILCSIANIMITTGQTENIQNVFTEILQKAVLLKESERASVLGHALSVFVRGGFYSEIRKTIRGLSMNEIQKRSELLMNLAASLAITNRKEAKDVFVEAQENALKIKHDLFRTRALSSLVAAFVTGGFLMEAKKLLADVEKSARNATGWKGSAMHEWVQALVAIGDLEKAKNIALTIGDHNAESRAIYDVATALVKTRRFSEAEKLAGKTPDYYGWKERTLGEIAVAIALDGEFAHAEQMAYANPNAYSQARILSALAVALSKVQHVEKAINFAKKIPEQDIRVRTWRELAQIMAELHRYEDGNRIFEEMILDASDAMKFDEIFPQVLVDISLALEHANYIEEANRAFLEARNVAFKINNDMDWSRRLRTLRDLAIALAETGRISELRETLLAISSKEGDETPKDQSEERGLQGRYVDRASALRDIAITLVNNGFIAEATEVAQTIDTGYWSSNSDEIQAEAFNVIRNVNIKGEMTVTIARSQVSINKDLRHQGQELADAGQLGLAFARIGLIDPNRFLETMFTWQPAFERLRKGLSIKVIQETMRIMAWVHPGWQRAYDHIYIGIAR